MRVLSLPLQPPGDAPGGCVFWGRNSKSTLCSSRPHPYSLSPLPSPVNSRNNIKIVVFDLGGVIVRICRSWPEGCARAGLPVHEDWSDAAEREKRQHLHAKYQTGEIECGEFFHAIAGTSRGVYSADDIRRI